MTMHTAVHAEYTLNTDGVHTDYSAAMCNIPRQ